MNFAGLDGREPSGGGRCWVTLLTKRVRPDLFGYSLELSGIDSAPVLLEAVRARRLPCGGQFGFHYASLANYCIFIQYFTDWREHDYGELHGNA